MVIRTRKESNITNKTNELFWLLQQHAIRVIPSGGSFFNFLHTGKKQKFLRLMTGISMAYIQTQAEQVAKGEN
jgi:hypothetical protein